jgi:membrane-associated HD superfamily phosphohydrolase
MCRKSVSTRLVLVLVLALTLLAAAGCGGDKSSSSGSPGATAAAASVSADQVVKDSEAKMAQLKSASFTADMGLEVQGDPNKMTDPTQKAMLSQGISLHMEGKSATAPMASDMKMSMGIAGQTLDFGMLAQGDKAWVEYQGKWYAVDQKNSKSLSDQAKTGAAPTEQLKSLGLDPSAWGTSYEMVGTEKMADDTQVYHVKATADPAKLAEDLTKAMNDPKLLNKLGDPSTAKQLEQGLAQNKKQVEELKKSLKDVAVNYWIGVDDKLMRKAEFSADLATKGQQSMQGVDGMTMKMSMTMADFDQPVTVTPPAKALPIDKLMNKVFGGMMGGSGSGLSF